jgi:hypothetical protein
MIPKSLHAIMHLDLEALLGVARESKTLEFKRALPGKSNVDIDKFVAAVSSFANTVGGDLIIGVDESEGLATTIMGIGPVDVDAEKLRLLQLLASYVEPSRCAELRQFDCRPRDGTAGRDFPVVLRDE